MASTTFNCSFLVLAVFCCVRNGSSRVASSRNLEKSNRPSFAGATGGTWENLVGQRIPPGTPWPARAEDYSPTTKTSLENKFKNHSTTESTTKQQNHQGPGFIWPSNNVDQNNESSSSTAGEVTSTISSESSSKLTTSTNPPPTVLGCKPERPFYAGSTGGTVEGYLGQRIPSSNSTLPLSSNKSDTMSNIVISVVPDVVLEYKPERPSSVGQTSGSAHQNVASTIAVPHGSNAASSSNSSVVLEYQSNRPSFAGQTGGIWENYVGQRVNGTSTPATIKGGVTTDETNSIPSSVQHQQSQRPSFAGSTGGVWEHYIGQGVNGSSVVATTNEENKATGGITTEKLPHIENTTSSSGSDKPPSVQLHPQRPPFAGSSGGLWENYFGQHNASNATITVPSTNEDTDAADSNQKPSTEGSISSGVANVSYLYISLNKNDLQSAISNSVPAENCNVSLPLVLHLYMTSGRNEEKKENSIVATEKFLTVEKDGEEDGEKPVLSLYINLDGLLKDGKASRVKIRKDKH